MEFSNAQQGTFEHHRETAITIDIGKLDASNSYNNMVAIEERASDEDSETRFRKHRQIITSCPSANNAKKSMYNIFLQQQARKTLKYDSSSGTQAILTSLGQAMNIKMANVLMSYNPTIKNKHHREERRKKVFSRFFACKRVEIHNKEIESLPGVRFELETPPPIDETREKKPTEYEEAMKKDPVFWFQKKSRRRKGNKRENSIEIGYNLA